MNPNCKTKALNLTLIITSLIGYLEWGGGNRSFLFQAEAEILSKIFTNPLEVLHPFTILPLLGQVLLLITLLQKKPSHYLTFAGIGSIGLLLGFMFVVGVMGLNFKIALSTLPFLIAAFLTIKTLKRNQKL